MFWEGGGRCFFRQGIGSFWLRGWPFYRQGVRFFMAKDGVF